MKHVHLMRIAFSVFLLFTTLFTKAQNVGIGTTNPKVPLHLVSGLEGQMNFPYETLVVEKSEDSKLGIYSTSLHPNNLKASSVALGYTNILDSNGNFPSYEMQYGLWSSSGFVLRFNALSRKADGNYLPFQSYSNVMCLDTKGHVGINLTAGAAIAPVAPTANLHVKGTVRFESLSAATNGGHFVVIDDAGNLSVSSASIAVREGRSGDTNTTTTELQLLKDEIEVLKAKIAKLEAAVTNK